MCRRDVWYCKDMQELSAFIKNYPVASFDKDQTILSAGDTTDVLYVVSSGFVKVLSSDAVANEQLLWLAGRLDVVPSEQLFSNSAKLAFSYTALSPVIAYKINKKDFLEFANTTPVVMQEIARGMSGHYDDLLLRLSSVTQASAREKLLYTLQNITERFSASDEVNLPEIGLHITHQDLAGLIHASRETVSIELKKLKDEEVIYYDRSTFIVYVSKILDCIENN